jgi:hypothetical protein
MHCGEIETIMARYLDSHINMIVPNVSYGLHIHEVDLLVVKPSRWASEIEIKISVADLRADLKKPHGHRSNKIKFLYFAVPEEIKEKALELIPERAGLYVLIHDKARDYIYVELVKVAQPNKTARKLTMDELIHLGSLATMRIWTLKEIIHRLRKDNK